MNKTVNINLAGIFFHIDEDAYAKLQQYLETIKSSLTSTQGSDEIIADIEARIAELFTEKRKNERYVIGIKEVEEIISIMGQPEDYVLDEEIFEDEPAYKKPKSSKQLFRDTDYSYMGGVSSGLGHYFGMSPIWLRLIWILLTIFSYGGFILIYIALWIFIPEAKTTADKLAMRGEAVTVSNIERKVKEGFDDELGKSKNNEYEKYGYKPTNSTGSATTAIGDVISFILNIFVKFIGILLLLFAGTVLIGLFIGLFSVGTFGIIEAPWTDYIEMAAIGAPLWLLSLLTFFAVGIPFFFLFILGLKILMTKLRTVGTTAKLVLLAVWLFCIIGLAIIGIQQATQRAFEGEIVLTEQLPVTSQDTLSIEMKFHPNYAGRYYNDDVNLNYDDDNRKIMIAHTIRLVVKSTKDSVGRIEIMKSADGRDLRDARTRAENIEYGMEFRNNRLILNSYLTSEIENHWRDQEVQITLYLPIGSTLYADENTYHFHRNSDWYGDILKNGDEEKFLLITEDGTECLDCPEEEYMEDETWENSTDGWEENDSIQETEGEEMEDTTDTSGNITGYFLNEAEAIVKINAETTKAQLNKIAQHLRERRNIQIDFSGSKFQENGKIKDLALSVDCKDGFSGKTSVSGFLLKKNDYGFSRNYQGGKEPFSIGKM